MSQARIAARSLDAGPLSFILRARWRLLVLARLRQSILKWAFEGKLVDQDPNDEPASVLLARIKAEREKDAPAAPAGRRAARAKVKRAVVA